MFSVLISLAFGGISWFVIDADFCSTASPTLVCDELIGTELLVRMVVDKDVVASEFKTGTAVDESVENIVEVSFIAAFDAISIAGPAEVSAANPGASVETCGATLDPSPTTGTAGLY